MRFDFTNIGWNTIFGMAFLVGGVILALNDVSGWGWLIAAGVMVNV